MLYFDNNATTALSRNVKESIINNLDLFANPSSMYRQSDKAKEAIKTSRKSVARLINSKPDQIIFTSCATESNNTVFSSCVDTSEKSQKHIIVSSVEHSAILETAKYYEKFRNVKVTYLPVDENGRISEQELINSLTDNTILVSIMLVNNETGNIYPIKNFAKIVHDYNDKILFHTDATQAIGKIDVDVCNLNVDFLTLSGHKFHAPKGIGALYVKDTTKFNSFMHGGHQEDGLRAGTENIISIIAMGTAAEETYALKSYDSITSLRDEFEQKVLKVIKNCRILGDLENRVCNTSLILIDNIDSIKFCTVLSKLDDVCVSTGSACNSIVLEPSHVMKAMGINEIPIRVSLSRETTHDDIVNLLKSFMKAYNILKK